MKTPKLSGRSTKRSARDGAADGGRHASVASSHGETASTRSKTSHEDGRILLDVVVAATDAPSGWLNNMNMHPLAETVAPSETAVPPPVSAGRRGRRKEPRSKAVLKSMLRGIRSLSPTAHKYHAQPTAPAPPAATDGSGPAPPKRAHRRKEMLASALRLVRSLSPVPRRAAARDVAVPEEEARRAYLVATALSPRAERAFAVQSAILRRTRSPPRARRAILRRPRRCTSTRRRRTRARPPPRSTSRRPPTAPPTAPPPPPAS
mmetsp:Transcript_41622/g.81580  ORF Transcript_41622/g.81580 Transcript_41622/m.81580 type:complete len:263 (-) Transcript_41622:814-1602(-)